MQNIDTVHVVFKTHLDIGFTDLAENVVNKYVNEFIPKAIETARALDQVEGEASFIWTTGSWLIHEYIRQADAESKKIMEDAIADGLIAWHGLPFTTHTELMDKKLFEYGLSIAQKLDEQYGRKTIAAKMTDVPGHTKAIIPYMAKAGLLYMHIGVNPTCTVPNVPKVFLWKGKDGSELIVNYASSYGEVLEIEGLRDVLIFAHTGDNCGPSTSEQIKEEFAKIKKMFPHATIKASTLDAFAKKLMEVKDKLPVVYEEIGDTWIHGIATDPKKVAQYRALLRLRNQWLNQGKMAVDSQEYETFSMNLALVPEHTWGLDLKKYLTDYKNYSAHDFNRAREKDILLDSYIPTKYNYIGLFALDEFNHLDDEQASTWSKRTYSFFESSWNEQRAYLEKAIEGLSADKREEVKDAFTEMVPKEISCDKEIIHVNKTYALGRYKVKFAIDGSISKLIDEHGKIWADEKHRLGEFTYESFGATNYNQWFEGYMVNLEKTHNWADSDYSKPGMEYAIPKPKHQLYEPNLVSLCHEQMAEYDLVVATLSMDEYAATELGAPKKVQIEYRFYHEENRMYVALHWFDKNACRLPEAAWLSFAPIVDNPNVWKMEKVGEQISPLHVVKNGNRNLHGIGTGVYYHGADGKAIIETLDAALLSPGERRLLTFDNSFASLDGGMHFNLHNNIWGTNFPMWYEEDAKFRFNVYLESYRA